MNKGRVVSVSIGVSLSLVMICFAIAAPAAKRRAESRGCASSVVSICLAAKVWAEDHGGFMPTNFTCFSDELSTPKILSCLPSRRASGDWSAFRPESSTYEIVAPGMSVVETNRAFLRCKVHGHIGYSDTTVFDGVRRHGKFD